MAPFFLSFKKSTMARIIFSSIVSDISGSVGGHTIQRNGYGSSLRTKPIPIKKQTAGNTLQRQNLNAAVQGWAAQTESVRNAYNRFLSFSPDFAWQNNKSLLSGYNLFVKYNISRYRGVGTLLSTLSYTPIVKPTLAPEVFSDGLNLLVYLTPSYLSNDVRVDIFASNNIKSTIASSFEKCRYLRNTALIDTGISIDGFFSGWYGHIPTAGQVIDIAIQIWSNLDPIIFAPTVYRVTIQAL